MAVSVPLLRAAALLGVVASIPIAVGWFAGRLLDVAGRCFAGGAAPAEMLEASSALLGRSLAAFALGGAAAALAAGLLQTRFLVVSPGRARYEREGWARGVALSVVVLASLALSLRAEGRALVVAMATPGLARLGAILWSLQRVAWRVAVAAVSAGIVDYLVCRMRHERALWMTREEAERERRADEGDPRWRAERRRYHRQIVDTTHSGPVAHGPSRR